MFIISTVFQLIHIALIMALIFRNTNTMMMISILKYNFWRSKTTRGHLITWLKSFNGTDKFRELSLCVRLRFDLRRNEGYMLKNCLIIISRRWWDSSICIFKSVWVRLCLPGQFTHPKSLRILKIKINFFFNLRKRINRL
jgi:hypothetical protein